MGTMPPTIDDVRAWFPALRGDHVFLENAGGSQVPHTVPEAMARYMVEDYVQLGAGYPASQRADAVVADAHGFIETLMGADDGGVTVLGQSTTALLNLLANAYAPTIRPGDEIVVAVDNHESNIGPWVRLERFGAKIRWWNLDRQALKCPIDALDDLLTERTRIVAVTHVSNLLGQVYDLSAIVQRSHAVGARVVADGVAYAPHRAMAVAEWGVDYYVFSSYKVYGPHLGALYGRREAFADVEGPNHFFFPPNALPYKFELGSVPHELCAGLLGLRPYLAWLAEAKEFTHATARPAFEAMSVLEHPVADRLESGIRETPGVQLLLPTGSDSVGTFSFTHANLPSAEISRRIQSKGIGIRNGHMYAYRLCEQLGIDPVDGVVRASATHYNSMDDAERFLDALAEAVKE